MNQESNFIPQLAAEAPKTPPRPPAERPVSDLAEQAPLGTNPRYEELPDTAVDYTFPCSDPIAVDQSCADADDAPRAASQGPSI